jgi:hypothetical protein
VIFSTAAVYTAKYLSLCARRPDFIQQRHNYYSATGGADFNYLNAAPGCYFNGITVARRCSSVWASPSPFAPVAWLFGLDD